MHERIDKKRIYLVIGIIVLLAIGIFLIFYFKGRGVASDLKMVSGTEYISNEQG